MLSLKINRGANFGSICLHQRGQSGKSDKILIEAYNYGLSIPMKQKQGIINESWKYCSNYCNNLGESSIVMRIWFVLEVSVYGT